MTNPGSALVYRRPIIQLLLLSIALIAGRATIDISGALWFIFDASDWALPMRLSLVLTGALLLYIFILGLKRLLQKRFLEGVILLTLCFAVFNYPFSIDRIYWKFQLNKPRYLSMIAADPVGPYDYYVFILDVNDAIFGVGSTISALVYDESDEIALPPALRSPSWSGRQAQLSSWMEWINGESSTDPGCNKFRRPLGDHFYFMEEICV